MQIRPKYVLEENEWHEVLKVLARRMNKRNTGNKYKDGVHNYHAKGWEKYYVMVSLCHYLGLRNGEACSLNINDIDFEKKQIMIQSYNNKCKRQEGLYANDHILSLLKWYIERHKHNFVRGFLFYPNGGRKSAHRPYIHQVTFDYAWRQIIKDAGLWKLNYVDARGRKQPKHRLHDLRAKFCTDLLDKGYTPDKVSKCSRHKNIGVLLSIYDRRNKGVIQKELMDDHKPIMPPTFKSS